MRLLDTETIQFVDKDPETTKFAILSHTWNTDKQLPPEQGYKELKKIQKLYILDSQGTPNFSDGIEGINSSSPEQEGGTSRSLSPPPPRFDSASVATPPTPAPNKSSKPSWFSRKTIWDDPKLSLKIKKACEIARKNGFRYIWIDSCCIDKSSSSELSEAINSMYKWYSLAAVCYAYLVDVPPGARRSKFCQSRWFRRGWTLQELIAPRQVEFLCNDWTSIGSKRTLVSLVESATKISHKALLHLEPLDAFSVAQRLSWAANRETTREEDKAYCLLGIFDINLPTLYGEGNRAFRRLQEQIIQRIPDQSIFAWGDVYSKSLLIKSYRHWIPPHPIPFDPPQHLFPVSPDSFKSCGRTVNIPMSHDSFKNYERTINTPEPEKPAPIEYTPTPYGIRTQFPMIPLTQDLLLQEILPTAVEIEEGHHRLSPPATWTDYRWYLAILGCEHTEHTGHLLGRVCYILPGPKESGVEFLHTGYVDGPVLLRKDYQYFPDLFPLSPQFLEHCRTKSLIETKTVHIPHPDRTALNSRVLWEPYTAIKLVLLRETRDDLRSQGYSADLREPDPDHPTHKLTLSNHEHTLVVEFQYTLENGGKRFTIDAEVENLRLPHVQLHSPRPPHSTSDSDSTHDAKHYYTVSWFGYIPWATELGRRRIRPSEAGAAPLTVDLERDFTGSGVYILRINVRGDVLPPSSAIDSPVDKVGEVLGGTRLETIESTSGANNEVSEAGRGDIEEAGERQTAAVDEAHSPRRNNRLGSALSRFKLRWKRVSTGILSGSEGELVTQRIVSRSNGN